MTFSTPLKLLTKNEGMFETLPSIPSSFLIRTVLPLASTTFIWCQFLTIGRLVFLLPVFPLGQFYSPLVHKTALLHFQRGHAGDWP